MLKVFKNIRLAYYFISIIGAILIIICSSVMQLNFILALIFALIWIFACAFYFEIKANKRIVQLNQKLNNCEIISYIDTYQKILKESKSSQFERTLRLNLIAGYLAQGDSEAALYVLKSIKPYFKDKQRDKIEEICYYNDYFSEFILQEKMELAKEYLDKMESVLKHSKVNEKIRNEMQEIIMCKKAIYEVSSGNDEPLKFLLSRNETNIPLLEKVVVMYYIGVIYSRMNNHEQAKKYFDFVLEKGQETIYSKKVIKFIQ